jgi:ribosomal protein L5
MTRLKEKYQKEVVPALQKEFGYKNVMAVPRRAPTKWRASRARNR